MSIDSIPIFIFTGFLGSGKTTLLSRLLQEGTLHNTVLIINEFGDIGIDHLLVETGGEEVIELSNGCLCCTLRGEIADTLTNLVKRQEGKESSDRYERIIIETTGLCDPAPLLQLIMAHPELGTHFHFHTLFTVIDTPCGYNNLELHQEAIKQAALADILILTKTDIEPFSDGLKQRLHQLNNHARIITAQDEKILSDCLFTGEVNNTQARELSPQVSSESHPLPIHSFTLQSDQAIELSRLNRFLDFFNHAGLLRIKGLMNILNPDESPCVVQGVQGIFSPLVFLDTWPSESRETRLVIIAHAQYQLEIEKLFNALLNNTTIDAPDFEAIDNNPLSISNWSS